MSITTIIQSAGETVDAPSLPLGAWDLVSFLGNAKNYLNVVGGALISLIGLIILIVAIVFLAKNLFGNGQGQSHSWIKVVVMIIIGGALLTGGIVLITNIASGGEQTIKDLGEGFIVLSGANLGHIR